MMTPEEILLSNPESVTPEAIRAHLTILTVTYRGFDNGLHRGQIAMHETCIPDVDAFFTQARDMEFPIEKVIPISAPRYAWDDEVSCADNNSSGFNYRFIRGTTRLSNHARGLAFDINPRQNIYIHHDAQGTETYRFPTGCAYNPMAPGTLTKDHPLVILMKERGWVWGGDWAPRDGPVDYQHFEKTLF
jgi:peptidoglycan LD-endopeptidase CwlK